MFSQERLFYVKSLLLKVVTSSFKILHNIQLENLTKPTTYLTLNSSLSRFVLKRNRINVLSVKILTSVVMISNGQSFDQLHESLKYMSVWKGL
jgi:uncharacterized membrane protein